MVFSPCTSRPNPCYRYPEEMTALDEIQQASRDLSALGRSDQTPSWEQVLEALEKLREKIRAFIAEVSQIYDAAILVTSKIKGADLAAALWKNLHEDFSTVLEIFERLPKLLPETDRVIENSQNVLRSIVEQADQEYRSYAETAYLLGSNANAQHLGLALEEVESGNLPIFESAEDLLKSLREK
jgi:hypothetical protein